VRISGSEASRPARKGHAAARRALQIALLDQIGFQHILDGIAASPIAAARLSSPTGPPPNFSSIAAKQLAVHHIQAEVVDFQHRQRRIGHRLGDLAVGLDFGVVAHPAQQAVGDARRAARAAGDLHRAGVVDRHPANVPSGDDERQLFRRVELQPRDDAETVAQRIGEHAGAGGGADQREGRQVELHRTRRRAFADHDVDLVILQRRVEDFLDHRREAVDFVDEQHIVRFQIGQQRRQIAGALQHRAGGLAQIDAHLARNDVRQRGLAQAGRAEQQHMIERFPRFFAAVDEDFQLFADLRLADILGQAFAGAARAR
jgi:hypothetical protein